MEAKTLIDCILWSLPTIVGMVIAFDIIKWWSQRKKNGGE